MCRWVVVEGAMDRVVVGTMTVVEKAGNIVVLYRDIP